MERWGTSVGSIFVWGDNKWNFLGNIIKAHYSPFEGSVCFIGAKK